MPKKLTTLQLERKLGSLTTLEDRLRKEARHGDLPGHIRIYLAKAADALSMANNDIRVLTLKGGR